MEEDWSRLLERGAALFAAPPLSRADKATNGRSDPKWGIGDLLLEVPNGRLDRFAAEVGASPSELRRLRDVASRWPLEQRVAASWSAHRDLKDHTNRFTLIFPGMTVREAAEAAGKKPIDAKPITRMSLAERADHVLALLLDKATNAAVNERLDEHRANRATRRATRLAADERSADYKEALRSLRQAQASKSPEVAFLEVVFKLQEATEYLRAVWGAALDQSSGAPLVPEHRKPELVMAIEGIAEVARDALRALRDVQPASNHRGREVIDIDVAKPRPQLLE